MSKKKHSKKQKRKQKKGKQSAGPSALDQTRQWFQDRHPILQFLLGFVGCMVLFYLFYYSPIYKNYLEYPFLHTQATLSNFFLNLFGQGTLVKGTMISGNGFSVDIKNGCDGLEAMAILISGILIFPVAFRLKLPGLLWGIGILFFLNLLRIAGLYLAGLHFSESVFDVLHIQGGFILFTMVSVLLWFVWMNWASKQV